MRKRLLVLLVAVILLAGMTVSTYAEFYAPEYEPIAQFTTNSGDFLIDPEQNISVLLKIVVDGSFETLSTDNPISLFLISEIDGIISQISWRYYEPTTQLVAYAYVDFSANVAYTYSFTIIGADADTITSVNVFAAPMTAQRSYDEGFQDGYEEGIENNTVVEQGMRGFFEGVASLLDIVLDIGIGALTIRNLVGVCVITFLVVTLIKIIRGS